MTNLSSVEQNLLGPDYPYYKYIKTPQQLGMSSSGNSIANNVGGLISYIELLVTGKTNASTTNGPLGDKFFLRTEAKCKDIKTNKLVNRYLYINNIPDGTIPFVSSGLGGTQFTSFEGLIPGVMTNMANLNPFQIFQSFMIGNNPKCQAITMETRDNNNVVSDQTAHVLISDIQNMPPCWFKNKKNPTPKNPITKKPCIQAFTNMNEINEELDKKNNLYDKLYYLSLVLFSIYLIKLYFKK